MQKTQLSFLHGPEDLMLRGPSAFPAKSGQVPPEDTVTFGVLKPCLQSEHTASTGREQAQGTTAQPGALWGNSQLGTRQRGCPVCWGSRHRSPHAFIRPLLVRARYRKRSANGQADTLCRGSLPATPRPGGWPSMHVCSWTMQPTHVTQQPSSIVRKMWMNNIF